jgi:hypothetical protein
VEWVTRSLEVLVLPRLLAHPTHGMADHGLMFFFLQNFLIPQGTVFLPMRLRVSYFIFITSDNGRFLRIQRHITGSRLGGMGLLCHEHIFRPLVCTITCIVLLQGFATEPIYPVWAADGLEYHWHVLITALPVYSKGNHF